MGQFKQKKRLFFNPKFTLIQSLFFKLEIRNTYLNSQPFAYQKKVDED